MLSVWEERLEQESETGFERTLVRIHKALSAFSSSPEPEKKQHHCFECGSTDPKVKLSRHAHYTNNRIPGWQNVSDECDNQFHTPSTGGTK